MLNASFGVLLVGDQPECLRLLRQQQFEVVCADRLANGLAQLKTSPVGLVLVALSLPDTQGTEAFVKIHEAAPHVPIIVLATRAEEKLAASLMPLGAQDYLLVPELTGPMLARAIHNANERHLIQEEHSRAGHLLQGLMDNIPDSIYFKDTASRFVMINRSQAKKFGLADPHLATGKSDADFFKPAHAQQALAEEQRIMQTGQPLVGIEEKETWPDGRETWVSSTKMSLRDRAGRVFGTFGISRDITEPRRMEQVLAERSAELLKERLLLRTLIDNLPDAIYAKDAAGRKTMANPADLKNLRCKTEADTKETWGIIPDLVLIDGGKGQLHAAHAAMKTAGVDALPLASLAKENEEIFITGRSNPIVLPRNASGLQLLQRVRDESHRFAVAYFTKVHKKKTFTSSLDNIPGIGPKRRRALLKQFGTVKGIKEASAEALTTVPGMTPELVDRLKERLG